MNKKSLVRYNRLYEVMAEMGFSSRELGAKIGDAESSVNGWKRNEVQPTISKFYKMADTMEVDVRLLFVPNEKTKPFAFWRIPKDANNRRTYKKYNRIKEVIDELGIKEAEFAKKTSSNIGSVYSWRNNEKQPRVSSLYRIADALEIDVRTLLLPNRKARKERFWVLPPWVDNMEL